MRTKNFKTYHNLITNRLVIFLLTLYIVGIIFGMFLQKNPIDAGYHQSMQAVKVFFNIFCMHYWYIFIIWLMGLCTIGFLVDILIAFFRGLIFGALLSALVKHSFKYFLVMIIIEGIIFVPVFMYLLYLSISLSLSSFLNTFFQKRILLQYDMKNYINSMFFITTVLAIYSIILTII